LHTNFVDSTYYTDRADDRNADGEQAIANRYNRTKTFSRRPPCGDPTCVGTRHPLRRLVAR
jgi:hypothetical protein